MSNSQWQFGAENFIGDGTVDSSSTPVAGFEPQNLLNPFPWSRWSALLSGDYVIFDLGAVKDFDYCAIEVPNWPDYTGDIIIDADSSNAFSAPTALATFSYVAPTGPYFDPAPKALWKSFTTKSFRYIRVRTNAAGAYLACLSVGNAYVPVIGEFVGLTPPKYSEDKDIINTISEAATFLGRTVLDRGVNFDVNLEYLLPGWVDTIGMRLIHILQAKPVFVAWPKYAAGTGGRCHHCWTNGDIAKPANMTVQFMKMSLKLRGV